MLNRYISCGFFLFEFGLLVKVPCYFPSYCLMKYFSGREDVKCIYTCNPYLLIITSTKILESKQNVPFKREGESFRNSNNKTLTV